MAKINWNWFNYSMLKYLAIRSQISNYSTNSTNLVDSLRLLIHDVVFWFFGFSFIFLSFLMIFILNFLVDQFSGWEMTCAAAVRFQIKITKRLPQIDSIWLLNKIKRIIKKKSTNKRKSLTPRTVCECVSVGVCDSHRIYLPGAKFQRLNGHENIHLYINTSINKYKHLKKADGKNEQGGKKARK